MRIIAGPYRGRRLGVPQNCDIRPTADKVRGAVFNMLSAQGILHGACVLDAFCGTGALGLEALSRGAESCIFIDKDREALNLARRNAETLGAEDACDFILSDASRVKFLEKPYDIAFLDPPYRNGLVSLALKALEAQSCLGKGALIVVESEAGLSLVHGGSFVVQSQKTYGDTQIVILRYEPKNPL